MLNLRPWTILIVLLVLLGTSSVKAASTTSWLYVSLLEEKKILVFARDSQTGQLERRGQRVCAAEPAFLNVSPDRRTLVVSYRSTGELASFSINPSNGWLTPVSVVEGGDDPAWLQVDHSGRFLLSAYYLGSKVTVHGLSRDGSISKLPLQTIPTAQKAHGVAIDSTNRLVFVPHTGANRIYQFRFAPKSGRLSAVSPPFITTADEDHPRHMTLHPSDRWGYVSNEAGDSIGVYEVDRASGTLKNIQTQTTLPNDFDGARNATARCEMTPNGRFVYVANRGHDSIACFAINQTTGLVTSLGQVPAEATPRSFTIDPTGRFLYVAGQGSGRIAAFQILDDGTLKRFETYEAGPVSWAVLAVDTHVDD